MKATGIVRRIDDLGRVVIPKEIRRTLRIKEGDPLEIFTDREGEVILKKYSPIGELGEFAKEYAESLSETSGHIALISDRDTIIAVSGISKKEFLEKSISEDIEEIMESRRSRIFSEEEGMKGISILKDGQGDQQFSSQVVAPIVAEGDPIGTVILIAKDRKTKIGDLEKKLAETAAGFLAKQMEQ